MPVNPKTWYIYLLRCADNSLYCGITVDVQARLAAHNGLGSGPLGGGAKYTAPRRPVTLVYTAPCKSQTEALHLEQRIKKMPKTKKEALIRGETLPGIPGNTLGIESIKIMRIKTP